MAKERIIELVRVGSINVGEQVEMCPFIRLRAPSGGAQVY